MTSVIRVFDGMSSIMMSHGNNTRVTEEGRHESRRPSRPPLITAGLLPVDKAIELSLALRVSSVAASLSCNQDFTQNLDVAYALCDTECTCWVRTVAAFLTYLFSCDAYGQELFSSNFGELYFQFSEESTNFEQQCKPKAATQWNASQRQTCYMQSLQSNDTTAANFYFSWNNKKN